MKLGLEGKVAVITGPAKGMGRAVSLAFALGNYPQQVRHIAALLITDPGNLREDASPGPARPALVAWADARVTERQPTPAERRIDEIGWAKDLRAARELSRKHDRPLFLFTMDGRIAIGRC